MIKRSILSLALMAGLASQALGAGTIPFSLSQQFDSLGKPLANCFFYTIQAGTTSTPQNAYQDSALTLAQPNPMRCDASGRLPQFFLADGLIKVRITDKNGIPQNYPNGSGAIDNIQVIGPSSGGGGGGIVDPTTIFQTGDVMWLDVDTTRVGWVRDNGRTIGSASSGATERANADTSALFTYLWTTYSNTICPVSGGRGASAAADFAANKTIGTPNKQGLLPGGLDGMGNSPSSVWASVPIVSGLATTPGSVIGATLNTLSTANLPPYTPTGTVGGSATSTLSSYQINTAGNNTYAGGGTGPSPQSNQGSVIVPAAGLTITMNPQGGTATAFNNVPKTVLGTFFRKL